MLKVDLHSHTNHSIDSLTPPLVAVRKALNAGLDWLAITDHNAIDGAIQAAEAFPGKVIVGEEIDCRCGTDLIGLFLKEYIPRGLAMEEVAERIRDQGGVVYAPHPYAYLNKVAWRASRLLAVADVVEVVNSRATFWKPWNEQAHKGAREAMLPKGAGSDGHWPWEYGRAFTEMEQFSDAITFLEAIKTARVVSVKAGSPILHAISYMTWGAKIVAGRGARTPQKHR